MKRIEENPYLQYFIWMKEHETYPIRASKLGISETIQRERPINNSRGNSVVSVIWRYLVAFESLQIPQDSFRSLLSLVCDCYFAQVAEQNIDKESARCWC